MTFAVGFRIGGKRRGVDLVAFQDKQDDDA
jgi:hypothetical protein